MTSAPPAMPIAFTVPVPEGLVQILSFLGNHVAYWLIPLALFYQIKYLASRQRLQHIALVGWGDAARAGQPIFFYFLWLLHLTATVIFTFLFLGYLAHTLR